MITLETQPDAGRVPDVIILIGSPRFPVISEDKDHIEGDFDLARLLLPLAKRCLFILQYGKVLARPWLCRKA